MADGEKESNRDPQSLQDKVVLKKKKMQALLHLVLTCRIVEVGR